MVRGSYLRLNAEERSYVAILKKEIHNLAKAAGFGTSRLAEVDIIVAELASNLIKHAEKGEVLAGLIEHKNNLAIEVVAIDHGPGIADTKRMMGDGISTTSTLGHGLGSLSRLSDDFQIYSQPQWGTIAIARKYLSSAPKGAKPRFELNAVVVPKPHEEVSGDAVFHIETKTELRILVADGLGHGEDAHAAVQEAIKLFSEHTTEGPVEMLQLLHTGIRKTRGAVINVLVYNFENKEWKICGIGNLSARFIGVQKYRNYVAYNGIVGHNIPSSLKEYVFLGSEFQQVIICSDGIKSRWENAKYPHMHKFDGRVLAAAIYRDYTRRTDDSTVLICKILKV